MWRQWRSAAGGPLKKSEAKRIVMRRPALPTKIQAKDSLVREAS